MNLDTRKRQRRSTSEEKRLDSNRKLRHARAFEGRNDNLKFVHAVDVASLESKCVPVMGAQKEDVAIELQYPSMQPRERCVYLEMKDLVVWCLLMSILQIRVGLGQG